MLTQLIRCTKNNKGFTLIEMLASVIILGIIAAIAAPNLFAYMNHTIVNGEFSTLKGAMKAGQREASKRGRACEIDVDIATNEITGETVEATPVVCLAEDKELNDDLIITTNDNDIVFGSKGNVDMAASAVFVVSMEGTNTQRCLVISPGLGIMRDGVYTGDPAVIDEDNCDSN